MSTQVEIEPRDTAETPDAVPQTASPTPPAAPPNAPTATSEVGVIMIPRVLFNYGVIAVACFVMGLAVGVFSYDRVVQNNQTENADLINDAVAAVVAALPTANAPQAAPTVDPNTRYDVTDAGNPTRGPEDAPITIIEFGDFNCHYCKNFFDQTLNPLLEQYEGQIRFVFRDYPILGEASVLAALAAECADDQGQFWAFHDRLYTEQILTRATFVEYATELNMDVETFTTCLDNAEHQPDIQSDYLAGAQLGVGGTPTFFINGKMFVGAQPYANFVTAIESELSSLESTPAAS